MMLIIIATGTDDDAVTSAISVIRTVVKIVIMPE